LLLKRIFSAYFKQTIASSGSIRSSITINDHKALASDRLAAIYQDMEEELRAVKVERDQLQQSVADLELGIEQLTDSYEEAEALRSGLEKEMAFLRDELELEIASRTKAAEESSVALVQLEVDLKT